MATTTWKIDPAHSSIEFSVKHMMITTVRGRFKNVSAQVVVDMDRPDRSRVNVEIDVASLDTGVPDRDNHLRSADFFDVERYPKILFRSKRVDGAHATEGDKFRVTGELTIRDTAIEIPLFCSYDGNGKDPWGNTRAGFSATGEIDRTDWGLKWNQVIETGGVLVANKVKIQVEAEFVQESVAQDVETERRPAGEQPRPQA